jgi:hypothetical protein
MQELQPAWQALLLAARGVATEERSLFDTLVTQEDFGWRDILEQAIHNKLMPNMAVALDPLKTAALGVPHRRFWTDVLNVNRHKLQVQTKHVGELSRELRNAGVRVAFTKGTSLSGTVYAIGERWINDVDLMIGHQDQAKLTGVLAELGYHPGYYDRHSLTIRTHSRKEQLQYAMSPDHLVTHVKPTGDALLPVITVDVAMSLTWTRSGLAIHTTQALSELDELPLAIGGDTLPCMTPRYQLIFTALHLFREAWFQRWGHRVTLMGFADILRLWHRHKPCYLKKQFRDVLHQGDVTLPVTWVLTHADDVFGTRICRELDLPLLPEDYLFGAFAGAQTERRLWRGPMSKRLRSRGRLEWSA